MAAVGPIGDGMVSACGLEVLLGSCGDEPGLVSTEKKASLFDYRNLILEFIR